MLVTPVGWSCPLLGMHLFPLLLLMPTRRDAPVPPPRMPTSTLGCSCPFCDAHVRLCFLLSPPLTDVPVPLHGLGCSCPRPWDAHVPLGMLLSPPQDAPDPMQCSCRPRPLRVPRCSSAALRLRYRQESSGGSRRPRPDVTAALRSPAPTRPQPAPFGRRSALAFGLATLIACDHWERRSAPTSDRLRQNPER